MEGGSAAAEPATAGWVVISQLGSFLSTFLSPIFPFLIGFEMSEKSLSSPYTLSWMLVHLFIGSDIRRKA